MYVYCLTKIKNIKMISKYYATLRLQSWSCFINWFRCVVQPWPCLLNILGFGPVAKFQTPCEWGNSPYPALCVPSLHSTNRWSYVHETDDEVAMVKCPQAAGRANQIASVSVSITGGQLHKRNRPKSYLHLYPPSSSWTRSREGSFLVWQSDTQADNDMEMMVFISTHSYEILALL